MPIAAERIVNGVDVSAVETTVDAIQQDPSLADFKFRVKNRWVSGGFNQSAAQSFHGANQENFHKETFTMQADEPPMLAGKDMAANPVEHLLHALASCLTSTMVYHAALRGIQIDELESELEGDIDLRGFLGLAHNVRRGYRKIRVTFKVKTDEENLERLKALSKLSPVFDVTSNGTDVEINLERK